MVNSLVDFVAFVKGMDSDLCKNSTIAMGLFPTVLSK